MEELNDLLENKLVISKKKNLGQFFTTNYKYILQNFQIFDYITTIIEPFAGNCDLLNFIENIDDYTIELFDIDPKKPTITKKDTLLQPPIYKNKFIITNPPYLARNKSNNKIIFDKYNQNDLYKCFLQCIINDVALGGIVIIPLNFFSSIRIADIELRKSFLEKYNIIKVNIFDENVFSDTTYSVCSFLFELKKDDEINNIEFNIYPSKIKITTELNDKNNYTIGGHIYNLESKNKYKITRLTSKNKTKKFTNILVKCIDDNIDNKISLSMVSNDKIYCDETPSLSSRTYATLIIEPFITLEAQKILVDKFNKYLNEERTKYNSLFLTNYRESKNEFSRKRISFELVYQIVDYLLD
jgi:hypothetical protein